MRFLFWLLPLLALVSACVGPQFRGELPPDARAWKQHQQQMKGLQQWRIRGRFSVATADNGGQGDLFWNQYNTQDYDIKLVAPFGGGTSLIRGRENYVQLDTSSGEQYADENIDALMARVDDIQLPVSGLRYWIRGLPTPGRDAQLMGWNEQGLLSLLEQDGWRISIRGYQTAGDYQLPRKIFIKRADDTQVDLRLVISDWGLQ
jgi:outer membrane lipoprotein LolB